MASLNRMQASSWAINRPERCYLYSFALSRSLLVVANVTSVNRAFLSIRIIKTSSSVLGQCSTNLGMRIISPGLASRFWSLNWIVRCPLTTIKSSSSSWWCHTNSPRIFTSWIWLSLKSPTIFWLPVFIKELEFLVGYDFDRLAHLDILSQHFN